MTHNKPVFDLKKVCSAIVIGAGHGIGRALTEKILELNLDTFVYATYRDESKNQELKKLNDKYKDRLKIYKVDPLKEEELLLFKNKVADETKKVELLLNSVGFLYTKNIQPEKNLREIDFQKLSQYFQVNSIVTPLLAKVFHSFFKHKSLSAFVSISAKVGSIGDNKMGGWYGYRASKAALNMFIKGISLEFSRTGCKSVVLAVHPGTTVTELSKPFTKRTNLKLHSPEQTASNILNVLQSKTLESSGGFYSWDGKELPW